MAQLAGVSSVRNQAYLEAFGRNLRKLRKEKGLSMEKLAHAAGVEYSQVFKIEHAQTNATISTVHAIAKALKIAEKELFDFSL
ncbi:XRE family transcriptional regulator [Sinomicrobium pectinilyticum]|uniref:XRE family transcriptional regulator n=1 Tax=Sinomicrobium pectinilyticum TaxID=1084421 RepID=A0A3N0EU73_SINP1|nr:helix-turn-helix transcriptional regulator [Sinomicrobium pectinilyticum]RNL91322.1 XRE family transcriptional regulator [Sinomicrobium pectinilyticum]